MLHAAAEAGNEETLNWLLRNLEFSQVQIQESFILAIYNNHFDCAMRLIPLLANHKDTNILNQALHMASIKGAYPLALELIASGAEVNYTDGIQKTAIIHAFQREHWNLVKLYLKKGADLNLFIPYAKELAVLAFNNLDIGSSFPDILAQSRLFCTSKGGYYDKRGKDEYLYPELLDLRTECSPPQSDYRCIFIKSPWQKKLKKDCFFIREDANFYEITYIDNNNEECKKQVPLDSFDNFNLDSSFDDIPDFEKTVFGQYQPAFINKILELTHLPLKERNVLSIPIKFDQMATQLEPVQKIMHRIAAIKKTAYGNAEDKQNKMDALDSLATQMLENSEKSIREVVELWKSSTTNGVNNWQICSSHRRTPESYGIFGGALKIYNKMHKTMTVKLIENLLDHEPELTQSIFINSKN